MDILSEIENIVQPILDDMGVELVELQFNKSTRSSVRLFVWADDGISLDQCTKISRQVADILEQKDTIHGKYFLEVSSPGIDRPLKTVRDFERQIGRKAKIILAEGESSRTIECRIKNVDESNESVIVSLNNEEHTMPLNEILSAKVLVEF